MEKENLTKEQTEILEKEYGYVDKAHYSEADLKLAKEMFDKPEKFALLRKILQVITPVERGLMFPNPQALVSADPTDLNKYAIESAVNNLADEKVRQTLVAFYKLIKGELVDKKREDFKAENLAKFKEQQNIEKMEEAKKEDAKKFGENL